MRGFFTITEVKAVHKLEFGMPEAMWVLTVKEFPTVVTMDAHGNSLHQDIRELSEAKLQELLGRS